MAQETIFGWFTPSTWLRKLHDVTTSRSSRVSHLLSSTSADHSKRRPNALPGLPTEVALEIYAHVDTVTLYQLTLVSREHRHTLIQHSSIWNPLSFDPQVQFNDKVLDRILCFLDSFGLHLRIRSARFNGTAIELNKLEAVLQRLPYLTELSVAHCTRIDCYQILDMLKGARAADVDDSSAVSASSQTPPFLHHLSTVHMRGLFPSERGAKSYAQELYVYGSIKKLLLRQGHSELSESHYALYQFWVILRSRMMLIAGDSEFRPPWLPDELIHFIQATEQQDVFRPIADIEPCQLCHKNVASIGTAACKICGISTPRSCAQCQCLQCANILCLKCYRQFCGGNANAGNHVRRINEGRNAVLPLSATAAAALVAVATTTSGQRPYCGMPWQMVRCRQCHISRRVCGSAVCQKPFLTSERRLAEKWYCGACKEKRRNERWKARTRLLRRSVRTTDDLIHWND